MELAVNEAAAAVAKERIADVYSFHVAGVGIRLQTKGVSLRHDARREVFAERVATPEIDLRLSMQTLDANPTGRLVFDSGMVWRLYEDNGTRIFRFSSPVFGSVPYKELRISEDSRDGEIVLHEPYHRHRPIDPFEYPLDELLVVNRLGQGLGCELHACGIVGEDGRGWIFSGHSGAGKSTLARWWAARNVTVLSDDRIILREVDGSIRMFGTPWHGEAGFAVATSAPLAGILVLEHAPINRIEPFEKLGAVSELMARAFLPFYDSRALDTALDTLTTVADGVPCARFGFKPDETAIAHLQGWMGSVHRG